MSAFYATEFSRRYDATNESSFRREDFARVYAFVMFETFRREHLFVESRMNEFISRATTLYGALVDNIEVNKSNAFDVCESLRYALSRVSSEFEY